MLGRVLIFSVICLFSLTWATPTHAQSGDDVPQLAASLEVITPGVEVMVGGTEQWMPITGRAVVAAGDTIRTDATGEAVVTWFSDGTLMTMAPSTEVVITEFSGNLEEDGEFRIATNVNAGRVFHGVRRLINDNSSYTVTTPSMVAAVRGTVFAVDVTLENGTLLLVNEGMVATDLPTNTSEAFLAVEAGFYVQAPPAVITTLAAPAGGSNDDGAAGDAPSDSIEQPEVFAIADNTALLEFTQAFADFEEGRADSDNDGVFNFTDVCPDLAGLVIYQGCPAPQRN